MSIRRASCLSALAALTTGAGLLATAAPAWADYGSGSIYQVEISANGNNLSTFGGKADGSGGGFWFWAALTPTTSSTGTADYQESDCVHNFGVPNGDSHNAGTANYTITGDTITIGPVMTGLGPLDVTVPSTYGHSTTASFSGSPAAGLLDAALTNVQVQVAP
jgi:hypothetical protein